MERIIFHIDVNSAYLSWSAIDLLKKNPDSVDIRMIPAIIGGNRKTRHGIVLAKSLPAKNRYHIHTAEPVANALKKCPTLTIIPPDHDSYSRHSKQFVGFLRSLTPEIELSSRSLLVSLARIGLGVAGVTLEFVQKALDSGDIRLLKTDFTIPARSVDMCTLRDVTPTAAASAFMEMVRQDAR